MSSRRTFLAQATAALAAQSGKRPNFLWISCEDTSPRLGCYGDRNAHTPNIDRLAREGVRYDNAFSIAGVCAPSRSAIITGMYPTTIGTHHMRCNATLPAHVKCFTEYLRSAGYYCTNNVKTDYQFKAPASAWDESSRSAHWRKRAANQPFFSVFNFETTHESRVELRGNSYQKLIDRLQPEQRQDLSRMTPPPYYPDTPEVRRDWANQYELITAMDYQAGDVLRDLEKDGLLEDTIVFFWGDHGTGLPRAKRWLYDSGTRVPLVIRIPGQFRRGAESRPGSATSELVTLMDLGPTLLSLAGVPVPEHMHGQPFLGASRSPERSYVFGVRDRMDERYDMLRTVRDKRYRYIRNYEHWKPYAQYMNTPERGSTMKELRRVPAKAPLFMSDRKPPEELYDISRDPHEIENLAGSAQHKPVLDRMRAALAEWTDRHGDLGFIPEPEIVVRERALGSRWAILQQPENREVRKRCQRLLERPNPAAAARALHDPDAAVRYWAATIVGNDPGAAKPFSEGLKKLLSDESAAVRVAGGRACARAGLAGGVDLLVRELETGEEWVRLQAALALDELGDQARPAIPALEKARTGEHRYVARVANRTLNVLLGQNREVA